jgi:hypothetical protein
VRLVRLRRAVRSLNPLEEMTMHPDIVWGLERLLTIFAVAGTLIGVLALLVWRVTQNEE